jgi:hypothetical protein
VKAYLVTLRRDFGGKGGALLDLFSNQKEGRPHVPGREYLEQSGSRFGVGAVVECQGHRARIGDAVAKPQQ